MYRWTLLHHWWAWLQVIQNTLWRCSEKRVGTFNQRTETDEWLLFILSFFITRPASFPPLNQRVEAERERERESSVSAGVVLLFNVVCSQKKKHKGMYLFGHVATNACEKIKPPLTRSSNAETLLAISFWNGAGFYNSMMLSWQQHFLCSARTITEAPSATQYMIQHILAGMCAGVFFHRSVEAFCSVGQKLNVERWTKTRWVWWRAATTLKCFNDKK